MWKTFVLVACVTGLIAIVSCDGCGGDPNAQPGCGLCKTTCTTYKTKLPICPRISCKPTVCECKDGFVFDDNVNKCVLPQDCNATSKTSGETNPNEETGPIQEPDTTDEENPTEETTPTIETESTDDTDSLHTNESDGCGGVESPCGQNAYWETCIQGCTNQSCNEVGISATSCPARTEGKCNSGCRCKPKYYRNSDGVCIPEAECPKKCGINEYWDDYIYSCGSNETCASIGETYSCPENQEYHSGCRCERGYWRNKDNVCVLESECDVANPCGPYEYWDGCIQGCTNQSCNELDQPPPGCPLQITGLCKRGCRCKPNYYRNSNGVCIPEAECPRCGWNELWVKCIDDCSNQTCADVGKVINCPNQPAGQCKSGCRCRPGALRNASNICVPKEICHPTETTSLATTTVPSTTSGTGTGSSSASSGTTTSRGTGLAGLLDGITAFTGKCLYDRMQSAPSDNIIMSAISMLTPIGELCLYSNGPAYDQCINILNLQDKQDIRETFPTLAASYEGETSVNFSTAAKVYSNKNYQLSDDLKKDAVDDFHAEVQEVDFSKNAEAADIINAWVASKTNNRITGLIQADMLNAATQLVLVNAIYFKGTWLYKFNKDNTKDEDFYLNDGTTKKTKLMNQELNDLEYGEIPSLDCKAVQVFYKGKNSSMIFVLPNTYNGTMELAKNLQNPENWKKVTDSLGAQRVILYIPSFEISTTINLKDLLMKAGIINWFDCENSGLTGLLADPKKICISSAIQKAWIKVDEEGSEAAAANGIVGRPGRPAPPTPLPKVFRADHSFLYFLRVQSVTMFSGVFHN